MSIALALLVPGLLGGALLAVCLARMTRRSSTDVVVRSSLKPASPDMINMAHIRIDGVGGIGMLGAALVAAIYVPEIGMSLAAGLGLGLALAVGLIAYRSHLASDRDGHDAPPPSVFALDDYPRHASRSESRPEFPDRLASAIG